MPDPAQFERQLGELRASLAEMGGLAEAALDGAVNALVRRDAALAQQVILGDSRIDAMERALGIAVEALLTAGTPTPAALREVLAALRIAGMIERVGDYAKGIAKRVPALIDAAGLEPLAILPPMARATAAMLHAALDAFAARDAVAAERVTRGDAVIDDFYHSLFRALLAFMATHPEQVAVATHLLFVAKNLERVGDQATNIAELVYLAAVGEQLAERGRGRDVVPQANAA